MSHEKKCAICGTVFSGNQFQCPKCGSGVFEAERTKTEDVASHAAGQTREEARASTAQPKQQGGWLKKVFGRKSTLSRFASGLLSKSIDESNEAIVRALQLSKSGQAEGLRALEEAIAYKHGRSDVEYYTPGLRRFAGFASLDTTGEQAVSSIVRLAKEKALWKTPPKDVQELLSIAQSAGIEVMEIRSFMKQAGADQEQVRAVQLLGLQLAAQVALSRAR